MDDFTIGHNVNKSIDSICCKMINVENGICGNKNVLKLEYVQSGIREKNQSPSTHSDPVIFATCHSKMYPVAVIGNIDGESGEYL